CTFRLTPTPGVTHAMPSKKPSLCYLPPLQCDDVTETLQPHAQVTAFQCGGDPLCRHIAEPAETVGAGAPPPHRHIADSRTDEKGKWTGNRADRAGVGPAGDSLDDFK